MYKFAIRNMKRNKRQNIFLGVVIAVCTGIMVIFQGIIQGTEEQLMEGVRNVYTGHIQVSIKNSHIPRKGAGIMKGEKINWSLPLKDIQFLKERIKGLDNNIIGIGARIVCSGKLYTEDGESVSLNPFAMRRGAIIAVESDKEYNLFKTLPPTKGNKLTKEERYGIYISETLANKLHLTLNETVVIVTTIAGKAMNALDFIVKGIYSEANFTWASYKCFINLEAAQELLNMEDEAMQLLLFLKDTGDTNSVLNTLYKELKDEFDLKPWFEANKDFGSVLLWSKSFLSIMSIFLLVLIVPQITNTSILILYERVREIGTLRAIGASAFQVVSFILSERIALFLIAVSSGTSGGFLLHCYLALAGIPLSGMLQEAFGGSRLYTYLSPCGLFGPGIIIFIISTLSSLYPVLWACKIKPVEALKHV